jgi:hypothetical protein
MVRAVSEVFSEMKSGQAFVLAWQNECIYQEELRYL